MYRHLMPTLAAIGALALTACADVDTGPAQPLALDEVAATPGSAPGADARAPMPGGATIAEIAESAGFNLLLAAVGYVAETNPDSPLVEGLLNEDQYTVFAPTDEAFDELVETVTPLLDGDVLASEGPFAAIDDLLGAGTVEVVLSYHVTEGRRAANSVVPPRRDRTIETLAGIDLTVNDSGQITAVGNTAGIAQSDISASNGIIHVVDAVLLPIEL